MIWDNLNNSQLIKISGLGGAVGRFVRKTE